ncbi:MAG: hypothetical protein LBG65_06330 [Puniceicoccales bacterium]|jgi:hypothetical protein|nr:hypothetical protein [Puniceicoccales bacterium]
MSKSRLSATGVSLAFLAFLCVPAGASELTGGDIAAAPKRGTVSPAAPAMPAAPAAPQDLRERGPLRCGLHALHFALKSLALSAGRPELETPLEDLAKHFPNIEQNGTNLARIRAFLEEKNIRCELVETRASELEKLPAGGVFFRIIEPAQEGAFAHLVLYRRDGRAGEVRGYDFPNPIQGVPSGGGVSETVRGMFATASPEVANPFTRGFSRFPYWFGAALIAVAGIQFFRFPGGSNTALETGKNPDRSRDSGAQRN